MSKPIKDFAGVIFRKLKFLDKDFASALQQRMNEAELCLAGQRTLPAIILYGSILEGVLFKYAECYSDKFNIAKSCPKEKSGRSKKFPKWTFAEFIQVSHEIGLLKSDTMKYVEILKDFENYVHIQKQVNCNVDFSEDTVNICRATLVAAIKNMKKASDTFETESRQRVRLADVNAPEVGKPRAAKATAKSRKLVDGKNVRIDPVGTSYGQVVANVTVGGKSVNSTMNRSISRTK